jgi:hypothetical protein
MACLLYFGSVLVAVLDTNITHVLKDGRSFLSYDETFILTEAASGKSSWARMGLP